MTKFDGALFVDGDLLDTCSAAKVPGGAIRDPYFVVVFSLLGSDNVPQQVPAGELLIAVPVVAGERLVG